MNPEILTAKNWYMWLWLSPLFTIPTIWLILSNETVTELICRGFSGIRGFHLCELVLFLLSVFISALWHLVLLIPATNQQYQFVRWHGRQEILLAGIRTVIPAAFAVGEYAASGYIEEETLLSIPVLIAVWLFGNLWGQRQAGRGDCALMRWTGHGAGLPLPIGKEEPTVETVLKSVPGGLPPAAPFHKPLVAENPENLKRYYQAFGLLRSRSPELALRIFINLLGSDATPELKARAAEQLKGIDGAYDNLSADVLVAILRYSHDLEQRRLALAELEQLKLVEAL